jgi:hypothetical protein
MVLAEVRLDVVRGVDAREVDPRSVARSWIVAGPLDEHADVGKSEEVAAGGYVAVDDRKAEWSE